MIPIWQRSYQPAIVTKCFGPLLEWLGGSCGQVRFFLCNTWMSQANFNTSTTELLHNLRKVTQIYLLQLHSESMRSMYQSIV